MSMTQLTGRLSPLIAPECAIKHYRQRHKCNVSPRIPLDQQQVGGVRRIIAWWASGFLHVDCVKKKTIAGEPYYRMTQKGIKRRETQDAKAQ